MRNSYIFVYLVCWTFAEVYPYVMWAAKSTEKPTDMDIVIIEMQSRFTPHLKNSLADKKWITNTLFKKN